MMQNFWRRRNVSEAMKREIEEYVSKYKKTEKVLKEKAILLENITDNMHDLVALTDTEGNFRFIGKSHKILGYDLNWLMGRNVMEFVHPDDFESIASAFSEALANDIDNEKVEYRYRCADNSYIWLETISKLIKDDEGNLKEILFSSRDISERKRTEEERLKIQKLESLGVLAGGIAHDFNNLLSIMMGNISMISSEEDYEKKEKLINDALLAIKRAANLSRKLLAFAKGGIPEKKVVSISKIIRESAEFSLGKGSLSKCRFIFAKDLRQARVDFGQVSQVIQNLVINANQAMLEGGIIKIKAENIEIRKNNKLNLDSGMFVHISVSDKGVGIPQKYIDKIFDPYFSTKEKEEGGSGLGLAVCHAIIKNHKGAIRADSKQGKGSTFHIYLPATDKVEEDEKNKKEALEIFQNLKILVMDDEEMIRNMLGNMLLNLGHQVVLSRHGQDAYEKYLKAFSEEKPFDAIILDLTVPGKMGGEEVLQKILKIDPSVYAIVSSGYFNTVPLGFRDALAKPYTVNQLKEALEKIIDPKK